MGAVQQLMMVHGAAASGGFTPSVLDDFNRADEGPPPSSSWTTGIFGGADAGWVVVSNVADGVSGTGTAYWNTSFGPDVKIHARIEATADVRMYWRMTAVGTSAATGYFLYRTGSIIQVYRQDNGSFTQIGGDYTQAFTVGDSVGATHIGGTIEIWYKVGAGSWASLGTRGPDSTYNTAGKIGIYGSALLDDFGGGTI